MRKGAAWIGANFSWKRRTKISPWKRKSEPTDAEGIVTRGHGKSFIVRSQGKDIPCVIRGIIKFRTETGTPVAVGDDVIFSLENDGSGVINEILPRRTMFFRPDKASDTQKQVIAANIDQLATVASVTEPALKPGLIDRFLVVAQIGGLNPLVIINKIDLGHPPILKELETAYQRIDVPLLCLSAETGEGFEALEKALKDHRTVFAGHSGVGKSSILNRLCPDLSLATGEISQATQKGIHTTSHVELFELPRGGFVVDSPGLKVLKLWEVEKATLADYYPEIGPIQGDCRFQPCSHTHEPGCAVKKAVANGEIPAIRYNSYVSIYESL